LLKKDTYGLWRNLPALVRRGAIVVVGSIVLLLVSSCGGGEPSEQTPAPSFDLRSPSEGTIAPTPPPGDTPLRLVMQESGATEDKIWRISPSNPTNREQVATIKHRDGWSVRSSLSPDSRSIAYIAVPEGATDASYQGELFMLDLKRQETELVYRGVDLRFRPMWTPDSQLLYVRRLFGMETLILQVRVIRKPAPGETPVPTATPTPSPTATATETPFVEETPPPEETVQPEPTLTPTATPEDPVKTVLQAHSGSVLTFIPVGIADDGRSMYLIQVQGGTGGGTLVAAYSPATVQAIAEEKARATPTPTPGPDQPPQPTPRPGPPNFVVKLSDQIARDYELSPDRKHLSYLAQEIVNGEFVLRPYTADLPAKTTTPVSTDGLPPGDHFHPLWHPSGNLLAIGSLPTNLEAGAVALVPLGGGAPGFLPAPERGFDVPIAWAQDGSFLAVINFSGNSLADLGASRIDLVAPTGQRMILAEGAQFEILGWFGLPA
jgi:hypothetical protein